MPAPPDSPTPSGVPSAETIRRQLLFASSRQKARLFPQVLDEIRSLEETERAAALYRSHPPTTPSMDVVAWLRGFLDDPEGNPPRWATWS